MLMFIPSNTTQAIGLAKLQENSIEAIAKKARQSFKAGENMGTGQSRYVPHSGLIKRELPKELEEKKAKGLCFKCNEKYTRGTNARGNNYMQLLLTMGNKRILIKKCNKRREMRRIWSKKVTCRFQSMP